MVVYGLLTSRSKEVSVCLMKDGLHYSETELCKSTSHSFFTFSFSLLEEVNV